MDERRARNHARDRNKVLAAMPSVISWEPAATTRQIIDAVHLSERSSCTYCTSSTSMGSPSRPAASGGAVARCRRRRAIRPPTDLEK